MATTWEVTADLPEQYDFDGAGSPVSGHLIAFRTGAGSKGTVFVPEEHYSTATVRRLVHAKAVIADEVASLTSEPQQ